MDNQFYYLPPNPNMFLFFTDLQCWQARVWWSIELVVDILDKIPFSMEIFELSANIKNDILKATKMSCSIWMDK